MVTYILDDYMHVAGDPGQLAISSRQTRTLVTAAQSFSC